MFSLIKNYIIFIIYNFYNIIKRLWNWKQIEELKIDFFLIFLIYLSCFFFLFFHSPSNYFFFVWLTNFESIFLFLYFYFYSFLKYIWLLPLLYTIDLFIAILFIYKSLFNLQTTGIWPNIYIMNYFFLHLHSKQNKLRYY